MSKPLRFHLKFVAIIKNGSVFLLLVFVQYCIHTVINGLKFTVSLVQFSKLDLDPHSKQPTHAQTCKFINLLVKY